MEQKTNSEPSLQERIDVLLARADSLAADILGLPLNNEEKEMFREIQEFRDKIGSDEKGEIADVYNGEELKQAQRAKNDLWDLKKIILERLGKEVIDAPKAQEIKETQGTQEIIGNERSSKINKIKEKAVEKEIISLKKELLGLLDELKEIKEAKDISPNDFERYKSIKAFAVRMETVFSDAYKTQCIGAISEIKEIIKRGVDLKTSEESKGKTGVNKASWAAEKQIRTIEVHFKKRGATPEEISIFGKMKKFYEEKGSELTKNQLIELLNDLQAINVGNPTVRNWSAEEFMKRFEKEEAAILKPGLFEGEASLAAKQTPVENGTGAVIESSRKKTAPVVGKKDEFAKFDNKTRSILTEDEMRTIATAKPSAVVDGERFRKESWGQAARVVDKLTEERIIEAKQKEEIEELGEKDIIEQIPYTPEEIENKRKQEAANLGMPTIETEADREERLKDLYTDLGIPTIEKKDKETILSSEEVKPANIEKKAVGGFAEFGINKSDLEKIEDFESLTGGQQMLVLESFRQLALGKIKEDALGKYKQEIKESGFFSRIKMGITKKYQIALLEKTTAENFVSRGIGSHKEILDQLTKATKEQRLDAVLGGEGELEIKYLSGLENLSLKEKEKIDAFNEAASEFSKIPYEWSLETANFRQRREFQKAKNKLDNANIYASAVLREKRGVRAAQNQLLDLQNKIRFNQFINTHPDVEKQLENIQNQKPFARIWKDIIAERGAYFAAGAGVRGITASLLLAGGVGVGAAVSGAGFAWWRTNEALKEQDVLARKGKGFPKISKDQQQFFKEKLKELGEKEEWLKARFPEYFKLENNYLEQIVRLSKKEKNDEAPAIQEIKLLDQLKSRYEKERMKFEIDPLFQDYWAKKAEYEKVRDRISGKHDINEEERRKNFVDADSLVQKIENLVGKIELEKDSQKKDKLTESLRVRINYSNDKLRKGLVNFGDYNERLSNNIKLISGIGLANSFLAVMGNPKIKSELENNLESFLNLKEEKISKARRNYKINQAIRGATYGALFFGLGYGTREVIEEAGHYIKEGVSEILPQTPFITVETEQYFGSPVKSPDTISPNAASPGAVSPDTAAGISGIPESGEEIAKEIQVQEIGNRGPEGAIIDYFKKNGFAARQLGYKENMNFNKWAGEKAHELWRNHADTAIKNPDIQETLKKLGYAPEDYAKGYEETMRRISNGGVKIDISKSNIDLVDMEYLKFKAGDSEDMPNGIQIDEGLSPQTGFPAGPQIDEGAAVVESHTAEAIDNVISINALSSVEKFAFTDLNFSVGEFSVIKNISVEKLLNEIFSSDEAWAIWRGEVEGKSINLPHYKTYWYTQFKRQVNLADQIRQIVKAQKINPDILKNISIGKFIESYIVPALKK